METDWTIISLLADLEARILEVSRRLDRMQAGKSREGMRECPWGSAAAREGMREAMKRRGVEARALIQELKQLGWSEHQISKRIGFKEEYSLYQIIGGGGTKKQYLEALKEAVRELRVRHQPS